MNNSEIVVLACLLLLFVFVTMYMTSGAKPDGSGGGEPQGKTAPPAPPTPPVAPEATGSQQGESEAPGSQQGGPEAPGSQQGGPEAPGYQQGEPEAPATPAAGPNRKQEFLNNLIPPSSMRSSGSVEPEPQRPAAPAAPEEPPTAEEELENEQIELDLNRIRWLNDQISLHSRNISNGATVNRSELGTLVEERKDTINQLQKLKKYNTEEIDDLLDLSREGELKEQIDKIKNDLEEDNLQDLLKKKKSLMMMI